MSLPTSLPPELEGLAKVSEYLLSASSEKDLTLKLQFLLERSRQGLTSCGVLIPEPRVWELVGHLRESFAWPAEPQPLRPGQHSLAPELEEAAASARWEWLVWPLRFSRYNEPAAAPEIVNLLVRALPDPSEGSSFWVSLSGIEALMPLKEPVATTLSHRNVVFRTFAETLGVGPSHFVPSRQSQIQAHPDRAVLPGTTSYTAGTPSLLLCILCYRLAVKTQKADVLQACINLFLDFIDCIPGSVQLECGSVSLELQCGMVQVGGIKSLFAHCETSSPGWLRGVSDDSSMAVEDIVRHTCRSHALKEADMGAPLRLLVKAIAKAFESGCRRFFVEPKPCHGTPQLGGQPVGDFKRFLAVSTFLGKKTGFALKGTIALGEMCRSDLPSFKMMQLGQAVAAYDIAAVMEVGHRIRSDTSRCAGDVVSFDMSRVASKEAGIHIVFAPVKE